MARTIDDAAEILPDSRPIGLYTPGHVSVAQGARAQGRRGFVDVFRGLLIALMALDHASLFFNAGRPPEELAAVPPQEPADLLQFLSRFIVIPVPAGFCFMAGFMVATTTAARHANGVSSRDVTRHLVKRGLLLFLADAVVMGLPRAAMGFYSFMVLSAIGASLIALALLRNLPTRALLFVALAILCLHPLLDVSALPIPLRAVLYEPVRSGAFRSMYPIVPWSGFVFLGFVMGRDGATRASWLKLAALSFAVFVAVRLSGAYGNAYPYEHVFSYRFWQFSKYPPDLPFIAWSCAGTFVALAALSAVTRRGIPTALRPFEVFGRVPLFFYMVHFYVLGIAAALLRTKVGLGGTYAAWAALLVVMAAPCAWYFAWQQRRADRAAPAASR